MGYKKLNLPKRNFVLEDSCFNSTKSPFMSLPNPSGTVRSFLSALQKERHDEVMGYFSQSVAAIADIDEIKDLFLVEGKYHFFSDEELNGTRTVALATSDRADQTQVIFVHMISEPDAYGKWKIYSIEKE